MLGPGELPALIVTEVDRIAALIDRMQLFTDTRPLPLAAGNIYPVLAHAKRVASAGFALTLVALRSFDRRETFSLAMTTGLRNMGILVAVMPEVPPATFLFFAVMQVPIYCAPQLLRPLATGLLAAPPAVAQAGGG